MAIAAETSLCFTILLLVDVLVVIIDASKTEILNKLENMPIEAQETIHAKEDGAEAKQSKSLSG